ncbi:MAG: MmgE/PrpD family protein [Veillonellales bacterium]
MSISELIAEYTLKFSLNDVPKEVREYAKLMIADSLGVAVAAYHLEYAIGVRKAVLDIASKPASTLWGTKQKVGIADAVLANAALIHGLDYDDTHVGGVVHPSASVVSTAFTVGEAAGASGKDILGAIICGYEIIIRLALAARGGFHDRGFHCTGIVAPFASACVAAKLLKLPKSVLINALGICGSQAAALQEFLHDGSLVKKIHPGWASHAGIYALLMAQNGLTGPYEVLEGEYGLYATHLGSADGVKEAFDDLGQKWRTMEISVKLYPICHMIHSFINCVLDLQKKHGFTAAEVAQIECRIEKRCYHIVCVPEKAKKRPTTDYGMRFSLPYIVAMTMLKGKISPQEIDPKYMAEDAVKDMIDKVECVEDETVKNPGHFPGWVKVTLDDGNICQQSQKYEKGAAENPIDEKDIILKYTNNVSPYLRPEQAVELLKKIRQLDRLTGIGGLLDQMIME